MTEQPEIRRDMPDILVRIELYKREEIKAAKAKIPLDEIQRLADQAPPPRGFAAAIDAHLVQGRPALIAEIKKASPSKGLIRMDFDPPSSPAHMSKAARAAYPCSQTSPPSRGIRII